MTDYYQMTLGRHTFFLAIFSAIGWALMPGRVFGQTGLELVTEPWEENQRFQSESNLLIAPFSRIAGQGSLHFSEITWSGRARTDTSNAHGLMWGWQADFLSLSGKSHSLPAQLMDVSIAQGIPLVDQEPWYAMASVGLGYGGDKRFDCAIDWYGKGAVVVGRDLGNARSLEFNLEYNGNRAYFPDVPLPGIEYHAAAGDWLKYTFGYPDISATLSPTTKFRVEVHYYLPVSGSARIEYDATDEWTLFAAYTANEEAFHWTRLPDDRRLIFAKQRVEAGGRVQVADQLNLIIAAGYTFDRHFTNGFDDRGSATVADLSSGAFFRIGLGVTW